MKAKLFSKTFIKRYLILFVIALGIRGLIYILSFKYDIRFQYTDSIPGTVYLIVKNERPIKGGLVAFWPPKNNFYHHTCFIKYVKGMAGDFYKRDGQKIYINDEFLGEIKKYSLTGTPLIPSEEGYILKDHYFMWSPHKDSYDSRYKAIGTISSRHIIGTAYRLF